MAKHPEIFDPIFSNMIEAGESSGTLGSVLVRLADLKESQMRLRGKIISGMTYPSLMISVAVVIVIAIFVFIIPKITAVFETMKKEIPLQTRIVMKISGFLTDYWFILFPALIFLGISFLRYIKTDKGKKWWDAYLLNLPGVGPLAQMVAVTQFARTMGTLLNSGVPILNCMNITRNVVGNTKFKAAIEMAKENITEGQSISEPLRRSGVFPPVVIHMISIGEKTGELPQMLDNIAVTFEDQANTKIERLVGLIEPAMIIFMGLIVGLIVMSVFLPLLEMTNVQ
jgi:general secretion pathway protein F